MHFLVTVAVLVAAPPSGGAGARLAEAKAALVAAERARGADVVEDPAALAAAGWTAERNLAFFARGAKLVSDGRRALARVELDDAAALLDGAERVYAPEPERPALDEEWAEAARWHGVALFELKRRDEAAAAWGRAKALAPDTSLTEAMVRPEVARAFAAARVGERPPARLAQATGDPFAVGVDDVVDAAIAIDGGVLTYAATRRQEHCASDVVTATRADELVERLAEAPCRAGATASAFLAPAIARPRPAPSLTKAAPGGGERRSSVWRTPWLWVGVVGALGVGVVLAASLWPRDATYSAVADFHSFALGAR